MSQQVQDFLKAIGFRMVHGTKDDIFMLVPLDEAEQKLYGTAVVSPRAIESISRRLDVVRAHYPVANRDHSDAWITCSCGWGTFGTDGQEWLAHVESQWRT